MKNRTTNFQPVACHLGQLCDLCNWDDDVKQNNRITPFYCKYKYMLDTSELIDMAPLLCRYREELKFMVLHILLYNEQITVFLEIQDV
jgi:hypothetical protein